MNPSGCLGCGKNRGLNNPPELVVSFSEKVTSEEWVMVRYTNRHRNTVVLSSRLNKLFELTGKKSYGFVKFNSVIYILSDDLKTQPHITAIDEPNFDDQVTFQYFIRNGVTLDIYESLINPEESESSDSEESGTEEDAPVVLDPPQPQNFPKDNTEGNDGDKDSNDKVVVEVSDAYPILGISEKDAIPRNEYAKKIKMHWAKFKSLVHDLESPYLIDDREGEEYIYDTVED